MKHQGDNGTVEKPEEHMPAQGAFVTKLGSLGTEIYNVVNDTAVDITWFISSVRKPTKVS